MKQLKIHPEDNVAVMLEGELAGHKIAIQDIPSGADIVKYGYPIGHATRDIAEGEQVHTHNTATNLSGVLEYTYTPELKDLPSLPPATFQGYEREDGSVGIRNEVWIINTVGCVNKTAEILARRGEEAYGHLVDGVYTFSHPFGCSQLGDDQEYTQRILKGLVQHPNAGAVLVLGLGCENNNIEMFKKVLGPVDGNRVKFFSLQDAEDELEEGMRLLGELCAYASSFQRKLCSVEKLVVGLKCGGSDGFSGLSANPLVGRFSDRLIGMGGSTVLTEVPEMFGAETLLMNRCINKEVFDKTVGLINDFKEYFMRYNQVVYENPSPGNKAGGITTLEDKSLGCVQKGGSSNVSDVLSVGQKISRPGLQLLNGPGNDLVAITNLAAAGCQLILFTTGRGTPAGAPVPTVKISTNTPLFERKPHWIDFDAGDILEGADLTETLFDFVLKVCGGAKINNEQNGYREISIFKDGVTL